MYLEYILAVYRLREKYNGSEEVMKILSQNNKKIRKLYEYIEETIDMVLDNTIEIRSFLELEIGNKGAFESIPNLLYALLVYVTGDAEAGNIRIKGLSMDNLDT